MRRIVIILIVLSLALSTIFLVSCSQNSQKAILGKWARIDGVSTFEFLGDGTVIVTLLNGPSGGESISTQYRVSDKNTIDFDSYKVFDSRKTPDREGGTHQNIERAGTVAEGSFSKEKLILKDLTGKIFEFKRIKQP